MKPIEPGCLCLVTRGEDAGKDVTTGEYCHNLFKGLSGWRVFAPWLDEGIGHTYFSTSWLMRIDGHEPEKQDVPEEMEVG